MYVLSKKREEDMAQVFLVGTANVLKGKICHMQN